MADELSVLLCHQLQFRAVGVPPAQLQHKVLLGPVADPGGGKGCPHQMIDRGVVLLCRFSYGHGYAFLLRFVGGGLFWDTSSAARRRVFRSSGSRT